VNNLFSNTFFILFMHRRAYKRGWQQVSQ